MVVLHIKVILNGSSSVRGNVMVVVVVVVGLAPGVHDGFPLQKKGVRLNWVRFGWVGLS